MAKHKFEIWQTDDRNRMFNGSRWLGYSNLKPAIDSSYKKVYEGEIDSDAKDDSILEGIFAQYQGRKPEGYTGRSVSVSDVIKLDGKPYFTDDYGFTRLRGKAAGNMAMAGSKG